MKDILSELKQAYPLLEVRNPDDKKSLPWDFVSPKVPEGMYPLIHEYFARYVLVGYPSNKGEVGAQRELNKERQLHLLEQMKKFSFQGRFAFRFYNLFVSVKMNFAKATAYKRIKFKVLDDITTDQEAASV
jgi:hypothetical protein